MQLFPVDLQLTYKLLVLSRLLSVIKDKSAVRFVWNNKTAKEVDGMISNKQPNNMKGNKSKIMDGSFPYP